MSQTEQPTETIDLSELPDSGTPRRRRRHWLVVGLLVLVLAVAYGALVWWTGDRVANGTTVAGIDVGGQTETEARATLEEQLPAVAAAPVEVRVGGTEATLDPQDAGLGVDIADTVDRLTGYTANPATILARLTGGDEVRPTVTTDEGKATAALEDLDARVRIEPVEGAVAFAEGAVQVTDAADGAAVDVDAARGTLSERWPAPVAIDLPTVVLEPAIGSDAVAAAVDTIATPLLSAPVTVTADGHSAELSPEQVSAAATFLPVGEDGTPWTWHWTGTSCATRSPSRPPSCAPTVRTPASSSRTGRPSSCRPNRGAGWTTSRSPPACARRSWRPRTGPWSWN